MVIPSAGDVVLVQFPFSDLSQSKLRPAVVLANAGRGDWILCQITSQSYGDPNAKQIDTNDFASGYLHRTSYMRGGKLFTANTSLITAQVGTHKHDTFNQAIKSVVAILQSGLK